VAIFSKTEASKAIAAQADTEGKAKADTDHKSVPEEPVVKKQSKGSIVKEEDLVSLLVELYNEAKNIEVQRKAGDKKSYPSRTGPRFLAGLVALRY
jgi:hypothetical protein